MSHYFHITPDVVSYHDNLEKGLIIFEFAREGGIQAFALDFPDQVFRIALAVFALNPLLESFFLICFFCCFMVCFC